MSLGRPTKYWIVVGKHVSRVPFRHKSCHAAREEAKKLALKYKGDIFTVFGSVVETKVLSQAPIQLWTKLRTKIPDPKVIKLVTDTNTLLTEDF